MSLFSSGQTAVKLSGAEPPIGPNPLAALCVVVPLLKMFTFCGN